MLEIFVVIFGLIVGSFIAAYSYRYPRGLKISEGTSFCDKCKRKIDWYENIPVISYILLRGKCKSCKKKISPRYPIIESVTAIGFLLIYLFQNLFVFNFTILLFVFCILELIFIIDFEHQIIPDDFVFAGILVVFIYLLFFNQTLLFSSILSGFLGATFLAIIFILTLGRGMGLGDVKFAVLGGMLVGINNLFIWMLSAFLTGALVGIILILIGNAKLKSKIAFGPFLIIAIPLSLVWGQKLYEIFF